MFSKSFFLIVACMAMVPYVFAVSPTPCVAPCNTSIKMTTAINVTISDCSNAIIATGASGIAWILTLLITVQLLLITLVVVACVAALVGGVSASLIAILIYLILTIICNLINILILFLTGVINVVMCRQMCETWYINARAQLLNFGVVNTFVDVIIAACLQVCAQIIIIIRINL